MPVTVSPAENPILCFGTMNGKTGKENYGKRLRTQCFSIL